MQTVRLRAQLVVLLFSAVAVVSSVSVTEANSDRDLVALNSDAGIDANGDAMISRICVLGNDTRSIELVRESQAKPAPCQVLQRRSATRETLWRAENDGKYCARAFSNYLTRLTSLGFDCGVEIPTSLDRAAAGFDPED